MEKNGLGLETELRLGLPGGGDENKKRVFSDISGGVVEETKNRVVGWPPVAAYRRKKGFGGGGGMKMYVKVSMDGAPFLRKIDLSTHSSYSHLLLALHQLFRCEAVKDDDDDAESSVCDCEYNNIPIYEDKDGDWMLLGDVPWEMFIESCRRLRIMKKSDAKEIVGVEAN